MTKEGFECYLRSHFPGTSGAAGSYIIAISILDNIFSQNDLWNLNGISLCCINDIDLLIYLSGSKIKDKEGKPELQILVSYCNAEEALEMYRMRWQIETMFKGMKSSGFDIEGSHVRIHERMSSLFSIIMIAYVWCYLVGIYIHENVKPIKVLKHGRRAVSLFKYGLDYISQCLINHTDRYRINVFNFLSYT